MDDGGVEHFARGMHWQQALHLELEGQVQAATV
jgi:hypothetical protein